MHEGFESGQQTQRRLPEGAVAGSRIELLQAMPVFGAIREDALQFLLDRARTVEVATGNFFFREGDRADSMFVLEAGRVEVIKGWQAQQFLLHTLAPGDCFGEIALLDLCPRSAAVRAIEPCRAIETSAGDLLALFEHDVEQFALIQMNIGREVCRRLRATDDRLFRVSIGDPDAVPGPWSHIA